MDVDNVVAPLNIKVSSLSRHISEQLSHEWRILFFFLLFSYLTTQNFLILSSYRGRPVWLFPACSLSSPIVKFYFLTSVFETSLFMIRPQTSDWSKNCSTDRDVTHVVSHGSAWDLFSRFFSVGLPSMAFGWLGDDGCPGYSSVRLHTVYKQSWEFSGFQFLLDMSVLFALIKIPILLFPPHNSLLFVLSWSHSCVVLSASSSCIQMSGIAGRRKGTATLLHFHWNVICFSVHAACFKQKHCLFKHGRQKLRLSNYLAACGPGRVSPRDYRFEFEQDWQHCLP